MARWTGKLPKLDDNEWRLLHAMHADEGRKVTAAEARSLTRWKAKELRERLDGALVGFVDRLPDNWLRLNEEGIAVVEARQDLLDPETLAERLKSLTVALQQVYDSGLNRRAIVVLLRDATGEKVSSIERVLDGIETIRDRYCSKT